MTSSVGRVYKTGHQSPPRGHDAPPAPVRDVAGSVLPPSGPTRNRGPTETHPTRVSDSYCLAHPPQTHPTPLTFSGRIHSDPVDTRTRVSPPTLKARLPSDTDHLETQR